MSLQEKGDDRLEACSTSGNDRLEAHPTLNSSIPDEVQLADRVDPVAQAPASTNGFDKAVIGDSVSDGEADMAQAVTVGTTIPFQGVHDVTNDPVPDTRVPVFAEATDATGTADPVSTLATAEMPTGASETAAMTTRPESKVSFWRSLPAWLQAAIESRLPWLVVLWIAGVIVCSMRPIFGVWNQWQLQHFGLSPVPEGVSRSLRRTGSQNESGSVGADFAIHIGSSSGGGRLPAANDFVARQRVDRYDPGATRSDPGSRTGSRATSRLADQCIAGRRRNCAVLSSRGLVVVSTPMRYTNGNCVATTWRLA